MMAVAGFFFFFNDTATTEIYTLSLHDALPIWTSSIVQPSARASESEKNGIPRFAFSEPSMGSTTTTCGPARRRSEEHTSELQSQSNLVCRLLLEKKKRIANTREPLYHAIRTTT